jgi:diguanylate cyclase (GGDEF)-like protein/PAS domain S-box-containing protein
MRAAIRRLRAGLHAGRGLALPLTRSFLLIFIPAAVLLTAAFAFWLHMDAEQQLARLQAHETARVRLAADLMDHTLDEVASDLMVLASTPCLHRYVDRGQSTDLRCVEALFADVVREKRLYDQARFLDERGMEIVRVNLLASGAGIVPAEELQPKGGRYFFRDTIALKEREIYVSPLDLNIEHDKIDIPHKPMLRLGTPITGRKGEKKGAVILNLLGDVLIARFDEAMVGSPQPMLLNRDGYWLRHPQPTKAWGFMYGRQDTMAIEAPQDWQRLHDADSGSYLENVGLYSFATVHPLRAGHRTSTGSPLAQGSSEKQLADADYFWKVVSLVPAESLPVAGLVDTPRRAAWLLVSWFTLALIVVPVARANASRRRLQRALGDSERQLREITATLGEGVFTLDEAGCIVFANPEAERLLGWSQSELVGQNAHQLFHHSRADGLELSAADCPIRLALRSGDCYRSEREIFWRRNGNPFPVEINACTLMRENQPAGVVVAFQDISDRRRAEARIHELAFHDTLTGLPNRRLLLDRLNQALAQAKHHGRCLALLYIDLDEFKQVNDTLGHAAGDELLRVIARRLESVVRGGDTVCRQGGDEFVVLLPELAAAEDAAEVAEKILAAVIDPVLIRGQSMVVSASVGIAINPIDGNNDDDELMRMADKAMYDAKAAGRNTFQCFSSAGV